MLRGRAAVNIESRATAESSFTEFHIACLPVVLNKTTECLKKLRWSEFGHFSYRVGNKMTLKVDGEEGKIETFYDFLFLSSFHCWTCWCFVHFYFSCRSFLSMLLVCSYFLIFRKARMSCRLRVSAAIRRNHKKANTRKSFWFSAELLMRYSEINEGKMRWEAAADDDHIEPPRRLWMMRIRITNK